MAKTEGVGSGYGGGGGGSGFHANNTEDGAGGSSAVNKQDEPDGGEQVFNAYLNSRVAMGHTPAAVVMCLVDWDGGFRVSRVHLGSHNLPDTFLAGALSGAAISLMHERLLSAAHGTLHGQRLESELDQIDKLAEESKANGR